MNKKGFTLIELLACLALLGVILAIALYVTRDTLSTSLSSLMDVSTNQVYEAARTYVTENGVSWANVDGEEYTCVKIDTLVDAGYFERSEVNEYRDEFVKLIRDAKKKVINSIMLVDVCE